MQGATRTGAEWLISTPVEVVPRKSIPAGIARRVGVTGDAFAQRQLRYPVQQVHVAVQGRVRGIGVDRMVYS